MQIAMVMENPISWILSCTQSPGYVPYNTDCDDSNATIKPVAIEECDNKDNDCDGSVDEDLTRTATCGVGACAGNTGIETCSEGNWINNTCNPLAGAAAETCDNVDNDCDGSTDENLMRNTNCGVGECISVGIQICVAGNWEGNNCTPGQPTEESISIDGTCTDGQDNDCDGKTDDNDVPDCVQECLAAAKITYYMDADGDGYGNPLKSIKDCVPPAVTLQTGQTVTTVIQMRTLKPGIKTVTRMVIQTGKARRHAKGQGL